jgi:hypothetical protein
MNILIVVRASRRVVRRSELRAHGWKFIGSRRQCARIQGQTGNAGQCEVNSVLSDMVRKASLPSARARE